MFTEKDTIGSASQSEPFLVCPCPKCQHRNQVYVNYLGLSKRCSNCKRPFAVSDPAAESAAIHDPIRYWIEYTKLSSDTTKAPINDERRPR